MSDTIEVRYAGPLTEGVTLEPQVGGHAGRTFECPRGEWVELPAEIVHGTPHTFAEGYDDPADVDGDMIVATGSAGLTEQDYLDVDGVRRPMWQVRESKSKNAPSAAPDTKD